MAKKDIDIQNSVFLTKQGIKELKKEINELKGEKRPALVKRVARARDFGDLSENAEYSNAREELSFVEGRISELEEVLSKAKLIKEEKNSSGKKKQKAVVLGSKVTVNINGQEHVFSVVGEWEADPTSKKISHSSPLGKALIGKKIGDKVEVEAPVGKILYKVIQID